MSTPSNTQDFPQPASAWRGPTQQTGQPGSVTDAWRPNGTIAEQKLATLSRYAHRVIDRTTGIPLSADELANGGTVTAVAADALVIPPDSRYVAKTTGADAEALTLADGSFVGQRVNLRLVVDGGGAGTLTPATPLGFATIVLADAGDFAELEWTGTGWILIGVGGLTAQPTVTA